MIGQRVFILVCRDKHSGDGVSVHATRAGANAALEEFKAIFDDVAPGSWKEETWGQPRWCRYVRAHDEGPSAYIEVGEVQP